MVLIRNLTVYEVFRNDVAQRMILFNEVIILLRNIFRMECYEPSRITLNCVLPRFGSRFGSRQCDHYEVRVWDSIPA